MSLYQEPTSEEIAEQKIYREMGMPDHEYEQVVKILGRKPNYVETGLFTVMWSEHCSYKNSRPVLKRFPTKGPHVLQGPGEGAGVVDIGDNQAVVFKIESHNHPSAIEPYHGAATGAGGIIRDVFSMGARPIALLNSLRFGSLSTERNKYLFKEVVRGIADYGNTMGIPTVGGEVVFEESYEENPLVNAMCVGLVEHDKIQKGIAAGVGNPVIYVGAPTGRDGIHGATHSSQDFSGDDESTGGSSIPQGNPALEKILLDACLDLIDLGLVVGIQDMGAAGLTSSSAEMASKAGTGVVLYLDQVPQAEEGMTPYEMMLSETQERMLLVCHKGDEEKVLTFFKERQLVTAVIGEVIEEKQLRLQFHGEIVADLPVDSLAEDSPVYYRTSEEPDYYRQYGDYKNEDLPELKDYEESLTKLLKSPTITNKEWLYRQFTYQTGDGTLVPPGSDAGVVQIPGTKKAIAMTTDGNARYVYLDPKTGGAIAVAEASRNLVCSGAEPLALTDGLNYGNPEKPEIFWQFEESAAGMTEASLALNVPVISGNVSFHNESRGTAIYPTPIVGMVGLIRDLNHVTTQSFKQEGDVIVLLGETNGELLGTEYQKIVLGEISGRPPAINLEQEQAVQKVTLEAIRKGIVRSAHDVSDGGVAVALVESAIAGQLGIKVDWNIALRGDMALFGESQSRIILSLSEQDVNEIERLAQEHDVQLTRLGAVGGDRFQIKHNGEIAIDMGMEQITSLWKDELECLMK